MSTSLLEDVVEVYQQPLPAEDRYQYCTTCRPGETVPVHLGAREFQIDLSRVF